MSQQPQTVIITTKNTASLTLGIIAIVVGVLALLFGWVPFVGLLAVPIALIGGLLALLGIVIAMFKGFRGLGMPLLGAVICFCALILPILSTGGASTAITESLDNASQEIQLQQESIQQENQREEEQEQTTNATYIAQNLELYDLSAGYVESMTNNWVPGVYFKLRNNGQRSLDKVEVTVYFKDAAGKVIMEETYLPVLVTEFSISNDAKPLKPGYVWQMEEGKFYTSTSVPSEWQEGSIEARVTDIRFSES